MVNVGEIVNTTELWGAMEPVILGKISPLLTIFKAVGIALLIYIIYLILRALFKWKAVSRIKKISKNVEEINDKLDILIKEKTKSKEKSKNQKKKKGKK